MNTLKKIFFSLCTLALVTLPATALAADPFGKKNLNETATQAYGSTPVGDVETITGRIINGFLGLLGIVFVVLIVYAGFTWMTAQGNEEKVVTAKKLIVQATIGLIVILAAYAITEFVVTNVQEAVI